MTEHRSKTVHLPSMNPFVHRSCSSERLRACSENKRPVKWHNARIVLMYAVEPLGRRIVIRTLEADIRIAGDAQVALQ
jgi:predicted metalloprotease